MVSEFMLSLLLLLFSVNECLCVFYCETCYNLLVYLLSRKDIFCCQVSKYVGYIFFCLVQNWYATVNLFSLLC